MSDEVLFLDEDSDLNIILSKQDRWKVLVVDDDQEVHTITKLALLNFMLYEKTLDIVSAYSAKEAINILKSQKFAVVLLDVVMESDSAGFEVVEFLRNSCNDLQVRIIIRTGQPGRAQERFVIDHYDINDYKEKTELTTDKLYTTMRTALMQYKQLLDLQQSLDAVTSVKSSLKIVTQRLEYAINGTQDGLWDWNLQTNEVYFSPRWKEMLGYTDSELPNTFTTWEQNVHPGDIEQAKRDIILCHNKAGLLYSNTYRMRHKDGHWVWILARGQTIFNEEGKAIRMVGFHTDITKQKKLEAELLAQEDMMIAQSRHVAMGEMIGMIAHQWRQPLSVIAMGANNMLLDIEFGEGKVENFKHEAQQILKQTEYLSKTIDDFRTFFRPNKGKDEIKILDVFLEAKQIIGKSLENHNIELTIIDNSNETLFTYSRELLQVVLNLLKNAKEALEERKTNNAYIHVNIESLEQSLVITVCDNGGGIDENNLERIFEPYFSTKEAKTGTGLGLYMSKTIIEKHLYGIILAKNSGEGACFIITLPKFFKAK